MIHEFVEHTIALKVQNNQMNFYISNTMASILYDEKNKLTYWEWNRLEEAYKGSIHCLGKRIRN